MNNNAIIPRLAGGQYPAIDILKVMLAYMVVLRHCAQTYLAPESILYKVIVNGLSALAVPTFFAISAFLLYAGRGKLKNQVWRIVRLYLVWTILYLPINLLRIIIKGKDVLQSVFELIQYTVMSGSYYHLWFLPALAIGLVFFSGLKRICNKKSVLVAICSLLFVAGILGDSWRVLIRGTWVESVYKIYEIPFVTTRNGIFFAPLFICIGFLVAENRRQIDKALVAGVAIVSIIIAVVEWNFTKNNSVNNMMLYTVFAVPVVIMTLTIKAEKRSYPTLRRISTLAFCGHPWVILFVSQLPVYSGDFVGKCILVVLITTVISFGIERISLRFKVFSYLY